MYSFPYLKYTLEHILGHSLVDLLVSDLLFPYQLHGAHDLKYISGIIITDNLLAVFGAT